LTGLASYLGQRAQDEVFLWLEDDLIHRLCTDTYTLSLGTANPVTFKGSDIFPATCAITDPTTPNIGAAFAAALREDLEGLPLQFAVRILGVDPSLAADIVARLQMLQQGQPPLQVLAGMASQTPPSVEYTLCSSSSPELLACALVGVGVLAEWSGDAQTNAQSLQRAIAGLSPQVDIVASFAEFVNSTCSALGSACVLRTLDPTNDRDAITNFLQKVQAIYTIISTPASGSAADLASRGGQLIAAVVAALDAGDSFLNATAKPVFDKDWALIEPALDATAEFLQGQTAAGVADALKELADVLNNYKSSVPPAILTTVSLAADLATAQSAQDVQSALETAAAPLGSWRSKHQHFSVAVNAYVGGAFGYESPVQGASSALRADWAGGAFAPVGIDVTNPCFGDWAWGLFVSALDVGQLLTSPVGASTGAATASQPAMTAIPGGSVNVVQVLSPGLYLHMSIGNSPITLGAGASVAPLLRYYADESGTKTPYSMIRGNAFVGVDLDLIPLYMSR
jgi:hypothetical protein